MPSRQVSVSGVFWIWCWSNSSQTPLHDEIGLKGMSGRFGHELIRETIQRRPIAFNFDEQLCFDERHRIDESRR